MSWDEYKQKKIKQMQEDRERQQRELQYQQATNRMNTYDTIKRNALRETGEAIKQENLIRQQQRQALEDEVKRQANQINQNFAKSNPQTVTLPTANYRNIILDNNKNNSILQNLKVSNEYIQPKETGILKQGDENSFKRTLATGMDVIQDLGSGFMKPVENVIDIGANILATKNDLQSKAELLTGNTAKGLNLQRQAREQREFANKNLAERASQNVANVNPLGIAYNILNGTPQRIIDPEDVGYDTSKNIFENMDRIYRNQGKTPDFEKSSVLGEIPDKIVNQVGYTAGQAMIGENVLGKAANIPVNIAGKTLNIPTLAAAGGMAGGLEEANNKENVSEIERWTKAIYGGLIEGTTEGLFGFLGVGGNDFTDILGQKVSSKFSSSAAKTLAKLGFQATGESAEEFLSYAANYLIDNGIINKLGDADFSSKWNGEELGEEVALAFASTLLSGGGQSLITNNKAIKAKEQELGRQLTSQERANVIQDVINDTFKSTKKEQTPKLPQKASVNPLQEIRQQITLPENKNGLKSNVEASLPVQNYKNAAIEEIKNSKVSEQEKNVMLDAVNSMQEVTQNDLQDIKASINEATKISNEMNKLPTQGDYRNDTQRKQTYMKYKNDTNSYDSQVVDEVLEVSPTNRRGNRTVKQWLNIADEIGTRLADKTDAEIERIAYKSWFDLQPTKSISRYDSNTKSNVAFQRLTSDEWVNTINKAVNEARETTKVPLPMQIKQNKDTSQVNQEVLNYIKKNNIPMSVDQFMEWASNKQLEQEDNMTPQQQELYNLINDIQNRTSNQNIEKNNKKMYNIDEKEEYHKYHTKSLDEKVRLRSGSELKPSVLAYDNGNYYVIKNNTYGDYTIEDVIPAQNKEVNEQIEKSFERIEEVYDRVRRRNNDRISGEQNRYGNSEDNLSKTNEQQTWTEYADTVLEEYEKNNGRKFNVKSERNKQKLKDSNKSLFSMDNQGRTLSKQQQEYFKDSKARDDKGNLLVLYHGTPNGGFNTFDINFRGTTTDTTGTGDYGKGFYFTPNKQMAEGYSENDTYNKGNKQVYEVYLDMKNPLRLDLLNKISKDGLDLIKKYGWQNTTDEMYDEIYKKNGLTREEFEKMDEAQTMLGDNWQDIELSELGYDGIINENRNEYIVFDSNQIKKVDNTEPTINPDIRYELEDTSNNTEENEIQRKINRSMTMQEAKDMIQRAFVTGNIEEWYDGKYKNGDEWIKGEGIDDAAMWIENDYNLQNKYINSNQDILNEEYMIEDVLDAYVNGTLTGAESKVNRLDTSKSTDYTDERFYAPQDIKGGKELYEIANQRVTNANKQEVYKARADFIINAHNEGYAESLGLTQKEVNEKLRNWANYPKKAMEISQFINKGVALQNRWTGIENSSIVNELSVSEKQVDSLVKQIKGTTNEWQRRYIANTMLAIDTHMDYKSLTYDFAPDVATMHENALADYYADTDTIRVKREGQNTIAHETGHFIDHLLGRKIGDGYNLGITRLCRSNYESDFANKGYTTEQKQFLGNFNSFLTNIEDSSDIGSKYKMDSQEVFARFVARFTEWTRNTATNNRYSYEASWYNDKFTTAQYMEFAKLLQEYSMLETTGQVSSKIDKSVKAKYDQRIGDIYSELYKNTETKQEITPPIPENQKFRKHYKSIIESQYISEEAKKVSKQLMKSDTYVPESNTKQLERADQRIQTAGADSELNSLMSRAMTGGNIKADDIAVGERLIQYYSKTGDKAKLQEAIQATAMAGTTAGQTVQAMSLLNHQTPEGQAVWLQRSVEKMNNELRKRRGQNADQFNLTPDMQQKILNSENAEELQKNLNEVYDELGQQVSKSTIEKIDAWRYFSMLANPKTHIRNIVGNIAMGKVQGLKNKVAGAIEGAVAKVNPNIERTHTLKQASKEVKQFAKNDINNVADRLELNDNKYNPKTRLENSMRTFKSNALENTLGKLFEFNNKALEVEDAWGLKAAYVKSLSEYMTANNLTPENITDKQLATARNYAIEQAKEATFHQASAIATAVNQFSNKNKLTKFISDAVVPFKKTPINVAKAGLEYSPVGLAKSVIYDTVELNKGNISVNKYIDNISKGLTGTGIALLGYALAEAGILKASGGDDKDKENYDKDRGSQSYSIQIGNNTYTLDWLAPTGIPLFIGAEVHEIMQQDKEEKSSSSDDDKAYNQAVKSATNILDAFTNAMNPMTEMSMLSGLTSALKSYDGDNAKMLANLGVNTSKSYVNQYVPTALGQVAKTADEYERSTTSTKTGTLPKAIDSTKNQIMAKIPGLRKMLPIKTDIWGNEQKQSENIVQRALENAVLPYVRKEIKDSDVDNEISRLYDNTGESSVLPSNINKNLTINKEKYVMTSDEYAKYKKQYGQTSYELIDNLVKSDEYKKMTDEQKQTAIENVYKYANEQVKADYAKENKLDYSGTTMSNVIDKLNKSDKDDYFEFTAKTKDMTNNTEKIQALEKSNYSNTAKQTIYENSLGKDDNLYDTMKLAGTDINEYLKYKTQEFTSDKEDDGTTTGKSVSGSKKSKVVDYVNNMNITADQKLLLLGTQYSLSSSEKKRLANYVNSLKTTKANKLKIYESLSGFTVYKDGRVTWK